MLNVYPSGKWILSRTVQHDLIRNFYHDWYRPDLQAIIVVGDIDPAKAEAQIKAHFSDIKNPSPERPRTEFDIPDNKEPLIAVTTDKEATENYILMFYKHPIKKEKTLGDFKDKMMAELFTGMLNNRFNEISQKPESPYVFAGSGYGQFLARNKDAYIVNAMSKENQIGKTLDVMLAENERVKRFGFTKTEFERQKEEMLSQYEKSAKEFDKTESMSLTNEYVDNYLTGDPIPGCTKGL